MHICYAVQIITMQVSWLPDIADLDKLTGNHFLSRNSIHFWAYFSTSRFIAHFFCCSVFGEKQNIGDEAYVIAQL